jgi:hypothetical protein
MKKYIIALLFVIGVILVWLQASGRGWTKVKEVATDAKDSAYEKMVQ